jgi:hypothetical protein
MAEKFKLYVSDERALSVDKLKDNMLQRMEGLYPDKLYAITDDSL